MSNKFRVAYLDRAVRRYEEGEWPLDIAVRLMKKIKRLGFTAWVEDEQGDFVPVEGARKRPKFRENPLRISDKDPAIMTAGQINKELDRLDAIDSRLNDEAIEAGRGHERPSEYLNMTDPLSVKQQKVYQRRHQLKHEIDRRYGPGAPWRLPSGRFYGPIKSNPPNSLRKAERLYETFHQFEPTDVGEFHRDFKIPDQATYVGEAKTMYYTSDKLNPETGEDEGYVRYFHPHEGGVRMYVTDDSPGEMRNIPPWICQTEALVLIGQCDGFEYKDFDGVVQEAKATGRKPEWFCIPSGKALLVIQDRRRVLAIVWGGKLNVEWRGVVG